MKKFYYLTDFIKEFRKNKLSLEFSKTGNFIIFYLFENKIPVIVKKNKIYDSSYSYIYENVISAELYTKQYKKNLTSVELKEILNFISAIENNKDIFYNLIDN